MKVEVKTIDNRKKGDIELSDSIFAIEPRADVWHGLLNGS